MLFETAGPKDVPKALMNLAFETPTISSPEDGDVNADLACKIDLLDMTENSTRWINDSDIDNCFETEKRP